MKRAHVKRTPGERGPGKRDAGERGPGKRDAGERGPGRRIAVSIGCPCGVGPEVSVVAAARREARRACCSWETSASSSRPPGGGGSPRSESCACLRPTRRGVSRRGPSASGSRGAELAARDRKPGAPTGVSGAAQLAWVDAACDLAATGAADALVTGPVSKEAIARSGAPGAAAFLGHTEHLQRRLRAREVVMAFWSPELATSLATTHIPLARVPREVTPAAGGARGVLARLAPGANRQRAPAHRRRVAQPARRRGRSARARRADADRPRNRQRARCGCVRRASARPSRAPSRPRRRSGSRRQGRPGERRLGAGAGWSRSTTTRRPSR